VNLLNYSDPVFSEILIRCQMDSIRSKVRTDRFSVKKSFEVTQIDEAWRFGTLVCNMESVPLEKLTFRAFEALLGERFTLELEASRKIELTLAEANSRAVPSEMRKGNGRQTECFSLIFKGPRDPLLTQRIYHVQQPRLGEFILFFVPIGMEVDGARYEVIFNRLIQPA